MQPFLSGETTLVYLLVTLTFVFFLGAGLDSPPVEDTYIHRQIVVVKEQHSPPPPQPQPKSETTRQDIITVTSVIRSTLSRLFFSNSSIWRKQHALWSSCWSSVESWWRYLGRRQQTTSSSRPRRQTANEQHIGLLRKIQIVNSRDIEPDRSPFTDKGFGFGLGKTCRAELVISDHWTATTRFGDQASRSHQSSPVDLSRNTPKEIRSPGMEDAMCLGTYFFRAIPPVACPEISSSNMVRQLSPAPSAMFLLLFGLTTQAVNAAETTAGPLAYVSLYSEIGYSTARPCAAGCLVYNGVFGCNNAGYNDLGVHLGCGCGPQNFCYCSTKLAESATAYISSCVSERCAKSVDSWEEEVGSMDALYDGYCATANVGPLTTSKKPTATPTPAKTTAAADATENTAPAAAVPESGSDSGAPTSTGGAPASTTSAPADEKKGLSQSDIVALAASLGVGIPSLLVAVITLLVQLRKKKRRAAEAAEAAGHHPTPAPSTTIHFHTGGTGTPVQSPPVPQYQQQAPNAQYEQNPYELAAQKEEIARSGYRY
ncbi:hypothetical protein B0H66DRAFT_534043 [Apodospora peruviana]|uniref:Extracellular membrane protein CFEM domain-containing protein n=1 Tax=Apodospora peruviana TaxID=516989 RepID=A0AAE0HZG2_9PEZI|nr:hypothetical protein B0H66DRAFT_534043 [Apodospora peruviana]